MMKEILINKEDHIAWVTLNRPEASNAFSSTMITELCARVQELDRDPQVRVIVFTGSGKHFCAGGDVKAMKNKEGMFAGESDELRKLYEFGIQQIPKTMEAVQTPTIAMVNGAAIGAGCDFACMSDVRIGSTKAKMGETFSKLALVPGDGGTYFLPRIVGYAKAMEMFLTGDIFDSEACEKMGLLNQVVQEQVLKDETRKLAQKIASNAPIALSLTKKALKLSYLKDLQTSLDMLASFQAITQRTEDHFEGIAALLEERAAHFTGK